VELELLAATLKVTVKMMRLVLVFASRTVAHEQDKRKGISHNKPRQCREYNRQSAEPHVSTTFESVSPYPSGLEVILHVCTPHLLLIRSSPSHQTAEQRSESDAESDQYPESYRPFTDRRDLRQKTHNGVGIANIFLRSYFTAVWGFRSSFSKTAGSMLKLSAACIRALLPFLSRSVKVPVCAIVAVDIFETPTWLQNRNGLHRGGRALWLCDLRKFKGVMCRDTGILGELGQPPRE
jgi:hypothetical protein